MDFLETGSCALYCTCASGAAQKANHTTVRRLLQTEDWCHLPNVHFFRDGLVAYDLRSHPGHRPREGHLGALVAELFGRAEVGNLHRVVVGDQHAGRMWAHVYNPDATCIVCVLRVEANQVRKQPMLLNRKLKVYNDVTFRISSSLARSGSEVGGDSLR